MFHKFIPTEPPKRERSSSGEGSPPKNRPRREQTAEELAELVRQSSLSRQSSANPMGSTSMNAMVEFLLGISPRPNDEVTSRIKQYLHALIARIEAGEITRDIAVEIGLGNVIRRIRSSQVGPDILSLNTDMMDRLRGLAHVATAPAPAVSAAPVVATKSVKDRLKSLKKTRKKEHKILKELFDDINSVYSDLNKTLKLLLDKCDEKADELGDDEARAWMQRKAAKREAKGKVSGFDAAGFLEYYTKLDELTGSDGITYREAYRGPVKRSWHVTGMQISSVGDLDNWDGQPVYIMWERRAPRQASGGAGGAKKKSNYNDYDEEGQPQLTWGLPTAASDIMSNSAGRRALFPHGRLVIVIEKFKGENPANPSETNTQHRIKGTYIVLRTPRPGDVKLCLVESRHFVEHVCVGQQVNGAWFFQQDVTEEGASSSSNQ